MKVLILISLYTHFSYAFARLTKGRDVSFVHYNGIDYITEIEQSHLTT